MQILQYSVKYQKDREKFVNSYRDFTYGNVDNVNNTQMVLHIMLLESQNHAYLHYTHFKYTCSLPCGKSYRKKTIFFFATWRKFAIFLSYVHKKNMYGILASSMKLTFLAFLKEIYPFIYPWPSC